MKGGLALLVGGAMAAVLSAPALADCSFHTAQAESQGVVVATAPATPAPVRLVAQSRQVEVIKSKQVASANLIRKQ
jgi:hypothetical protein